MRCLRLLVSPAALAVLWSSLVFAQSRSVAITVDDLPYAGGTAASGDVSAEASEAVAVSRSVLAAFRAYHVPVTGFVIEKRVESLGPPGRLILRQTIGPKSGGGSKREIRARPATVDCKLWPIAS